MGQLIKILKEITIRSNLPRVWATDEDSEFFKIENFPKIADEKKPLDNIIFKEKVITPILKYIMDVSELRHMEKYQDSYFNFDINTNPGTVILHISGDNTWYFTSNPSLYFSGANEILNYPYNILLK